MNTLTLLTVTKSLYGDLVDDVLDLVHDPRSFRVDMSRDITTLERRFQGEGDGFLTIALPRLAKHFLLCLEEGSFSPVVGFSPKRDSRLPCLLHGWWERIFCPKTGKVLSDVNPRLILAVRQILSVHGKIKVVPEPKKCSYAFRRFKDVDKSLPKSLWSSLVVNLGYESVSNFNLDSHQDHYWNSLGDSGRMFLHVCRTIGYEFSNFSFENLKPKHGPGSVSEKVNLDGKWEFISYSYPDYLVDILPIDWTSRPFFGQYANDRDSSSLSQRADYSRLIAVPKTAVTPRLIAAEPVVNQFWQQSLMRFFDETIQSCWLGRSINLHDQIRSQRLAEIGSLDRSICTIDLSDASDTVRLDHVAALLRPGPLLDAVMRTRSPSVKLPTGEVLRLNKFATMGSAVCFPIESLVFLAACASGVLISRKLSATTRNIREAARLCIIFGDDLIVPNSDAAIVVSHLRTLGFQPNASKTFTKSLFRESCGGDFFKGESVKPIYLREHLRGVDLETSTASLSWCAFARQCQDQGYRRTRNVVFKYLNKVLGYRLPYSDSLDGFVSHNVPGWDNGWYLRYNRRYQRWEFRAFCSQHQLRKSKLIGTARLIRNLCSAVEGRVPGLLTKATDHSSVPTRKMRMRYKYVPFPHLA